MHFSKFRSPNARTGGRQMKTHSRMAGASAILALVCVTLLGSPASASHASGPTYKSGNLSCPSGQVGYIEAYGTGRITVSWYSFSGPNTTVYKREYTSVPLFNYWVTETRLQYMTWKIRATSYNGSHYGLGNSMPNGAFCSRPGGLSSAPR